MLQRGSIALESLGTDEGEAPTRSRVFRRTEAVQLALGHARGMASIVIKGRRVVVLDLEEDAGDEDEDAVEAEDNEGEERSEGEEIDSQKSDGEDMAMEEDDM